MDTLFYVPTVYLRARNLLNVRPIDCACQPGTAMPGTGICRGKEHHSQQGTQPGIKPGTHSKAHSQKKPVKITRHKQAQLGTHR